MTVPVLQMKGPRLPLRLSSTQKGRADASHIPKSALRRYQARSPLLHRPSRTSPASSSGPDHTQAWTMCSLGKGQGPQRAHCLGAQGWAQVLHRPARSWEEIGGEIRAVHGSHAEYSEGGDMPRFFTKTLEGGPISSPSLKVGILKL